MRVTIPVMVTVMVTVTATVPVTVPVMVPATARDKGVTVFTIMKEQLKSIKEEWE